MAGRTSWQDTFCAILYSNANLNENAMCGASRFVPSPQSQCVRKEKKRKVSSNAAHNVEQQKKKTERVSRAAFQICIIRFHFKDPGDAFPLVAG